MHLLSIPPLIMSAITFYTAAYYGIVFFKSKSNPINLTFSLMCFAIGLYDIFCVGNYNSTSSIQGYEWQRMQIFSISLVGIGLWWFICSYTRINNRIANVFVSIYFSVCALVEFFDRSDLTWKIDQPLVKTFEIFGFSITYNEVAQGPFTDIVTFSLLVLFTYLYWISFHFYWKTDRSRGLPLLLAMIVFYASMFEDVMVSAGFYNFIYTLEYGYIGFVMIMGYTQIIDDIQIRKDLNESKDKYYGMIENLLEGFYAVTLDGILLECNLEFKRILGFDPDMDLRGLMLADFWEDKEGRQKYVNELMSKGFVANYILNAIKNDGERLIVRINSRLVKDINGKPLRIEGIIMDITKSVSDEVELKKKSYLLEKAQELGKIGSWELDIKNNEIIWSNEIYRIFGVPIGKKITYEIFLNCVHPDDREYVNSEWMAALNNKPYDIEHRLLMNDGSVKWVREKAELAFDEEGNCIKGTGFTQDITKQSIFEEELKRSKEIAEKVNQTKSDFLMNVSHDIRTPLNVINCFNDLLMRTQLDEEQKKFCDIIKSKNKDLVKLIEDIIDISVVEMGKVRIHYAPLFMREIINDIKNTMTLQIGDKDIEFYIRVSEDVPEILLGDSMRLKQILENLCGNAVKYTEKGKIDLTVSAEAKSKGNSYFIDFIVEDTGIGVSEDNLPYIFEPYSRFYDIGKIEHKNGVGLGLHIVKTLIKEMGGDVRVESEQGKGSKFSFQLKMKVVEDLDVKKEQDANEVFDKEVSLAGMNILVAEDDKATRSLLEISFRDSECNIKFAYDGEDVLDEMKKNKYDIVLMDIRMPGMNGLEVTKLIRKNIDKDVPILALTAQVMDFIEDDCKAAGMNGYISKPIDIEKLKIAIKEYIVT